MGALVGLLFGLGGLLVWRSGSRAPVRTRASGSSLRQRTDDLLAQAGIEGVTPGRLLAASGALGVAVCVLVLGTSRVPVIALAFGCFGALLPLFLVRRRRAQRLVELREVWPEAVDNLASGVRAGLSLPEALSQLGLRGPEQLRGPFRHFGEDYRASGRFSESLNRLKAALADPVGDRVVEALRLAREVGGTDLGRLLRTLLTLLRGPVSLSQQGAIVCFRLGRVSLEHDVELVERDRPVEAGAAPAAVLSVRPSSRQRRYSSLIRASSSGKCPHLLLTLRSWWLCSRWRWSCRCPADPVLKAKNGRLAHRRRPTAA